MSFLKNIIKKNFSDLSILKAKYILKRTGIPKTLRIDITAFCNAKCPFCPRVAMPEARLSGRMSVDKFNSIVTEAKDFGINLIKLYITSEPLLHPKFSQFIEIANKKNIDIIISTNLSVLQHRLNELRKVKKLQLSIEGWDKSSYEKYRFPLKYEKARSNFNFLLNDNLLKNIYKEIHLPVTKLTNLELFFKLWGDVDAIRIDFMLPYNDFDKTNKIFNSKYPFQLEDEIYKLYETKEKVCYDPFDEIVIGYDGKIHLCCLDFHAELPLGNIDSGFKNVLNNLKRKQIQKEFLSGKVNTCNGCSLFKVPSDEQKKQLKILIDEAWIKVQPSAKIIFFENTWEK
jgi:radical SAM protein with 4Fe4S-binding SPASM domain